MPKTRDILRELRGTSRKVTPLIIAARLDRLKFILDECWIRIGCTNYNEYDSISIGNKTILIHRASAFAYLGFVLNSKLQINHKSNCSYKACFNYSHLYIGTQKDNMQDKRVKYRLCPNNPNHHVFIDRHNRKNCTQCHRERERIRRLKKKI